MQNGCQLKFRYYYMLLFISFLATGLVSCLKEDAESNAVEKRAVSVIGNWVVSDFNNDVTVYDRTPVLKQNEYGYIFLSGGRMIIRGSSNESDSLTSREYEGTWKLENGLLTINANYWGGKVIERWVVIYLSSNTMTAKKISAEFPQ